MKAASLAVSLSYRKEGGAMLGMSEGESVPEKGEVISDASVATAD